MSHSNWVMVDSTRAVVALAAAKPWTIFLFIAVSMAKISAFDASGVGCAAKDAVALPRGGVAVASTITMVMIMSASVKADAITRVEPSSSISNGWSRRGGDHLSVDGVLSLSALKWSNQLVINGHPTWSNVSWSPSREW